MWQLKFQKNANSKANMITFEQQFALRWDYFYIIRNRNFQITNFNFVMYYNRQNMYSHCKIINIATHMIFSNCYGAMFSN